MKINIEFIIKEKGRHNKEVKLVKILDFIKNRGHKFKDLKVNNKDKTELISKHLNIKD